MSKEKKNRESEESQNEDLPTGKSRSLQSNARPGGDRDRDTATSGTTSSGNAGEIRDLSDVPEPK